MKASILMKRLSVLITDADNTLWDTNLVFAEAQLALLGAVEKLAGRSTPESDRLSFVRRFDQAIASRDHRGLKYPAIMLVRDIYGALGGPTAEVDEAQGEAIVSRFLSDLRKLPVLRPGVQEAIAALIKHKVEIWVVSEGHREIVEKALADHGLTDAAAKVVSGNKTVDLFRRLMKLLPPDALSICVGDQLDRDVVPAKQAGLRTAYFPGGFVPSWTDEGMREQADAVIDDFRQLLPLLGVPHAVARSKSSSSHSSA